MDRLGIENNMLLKFWSWLFRKDLLSKVTVSLMKKSISLVTKPLKEKLMVGGRLNLLDASVEALCVVDWSLLHLEHRLQPN